MADQKTKAIMSPVGRLINSAFWEKDIYEGEKGRESKAAYRIEMAFDDTPEFQEFESKIAAAAIEEWGAGADEKYFNGDIRAPIQAGDDIAADREGRGKKGDAYAGKLVLRATTVFNANGDDAPGGIYVADENAEQILFTGRDKVYNGCYGKVVVTPSAYTVDKKRGVTLYLQGFQFTQDGERLRGAGVAGMFKPTAAPAAEAPSGRRRAARG